MGTHAARSRVSSFFQVESVHHCSVSHVENGTHAARSSVQMYCMVQSQGMLEIQIYGSPRMFFHFCLQVAEDSSC
jgi:hypothetical protein